MLRHRKLIAVVCIAAMFVTALVPATWDLLSGVLVPVDPLFAAVVLEPGVLVDSSEPQPFAFLETDSPRGPPVL